MSSLRSLIFDLDDTLYIASEQLSPQATLEACMVMVDAGLKADPEEAAAERRRYLAGGRRGDPFLHIAEKFSKDGDLEEIQRLAKIGTETFRKRPVDENLILAEGVRETLSYLIPRYDMFLVTFGDTETQNRKIAKLGIRGAFLRVLIQDPSLNESKKIAFTDILYTQGYKAPDVLSLGNRVDHELAAAKSLGMKTCWVRQGVYANRVPLKEDEYPDFVVERFSEIVKVCCL